MRRFASVQARLTALGGSDNLDNVLVEDDDQEDQEDDVYVTDCALGAGAAATGAPVASAAAAGTSATGAAAPAAVTGGAVRTTRLPVFRCYMQRLLEVIGDWWELARKPRESRARFQQYIGKRRALDWFFGGVRRFWAKRFPGVTVLIAYGHAFQTTKPSGKGELTVPTTGTYQAALRAFGRDNVAIVHEWGTTQFEFFSDARKEQVYRPICGTPLQHGFHPQGQVNPASPKWSMCCFQLGELRHTADKYLPLASAEDKVAVQAFVALRQIISKARRKGACVRGLHLSAEWQPVEHRGGVRYQGVRSLKYSPLSKSFVDRDKSAARTIALLGVAKLRGEKRPPQLTPGAHPWS